jgi:hypothetical protein
MVLKLIFIYATIWPKWEGGVQASRAECLYSKMRLEQSSFFPLDRHPALDFAHVFD